MRETVERVVILKALELNLIRWIDRVVVLMEKEYTK